MTKREREMFYLTTHSTHFIYRYMASDIWLRTIHIAQWVHPMKDRSDDPPHHGRTLYLWATVLLPEWKETRCRHMGYSFRLAARVLLYAPSHRQDSTYHGLCYTSSGALAGMRYSSTGPPWRIDPTTHRTMSEAFTTELHLAPVWVEGGTGLAHMSSSTTLKSYNIKQSGAQWVARETFYLTTHSTHFIYGYMASDIWLRTILIVRKETRCHHIGYSYRLTARVLLYAPSYRQDNTYHSLCYTSCGALAGTTGWKEVLDWHTHPVLPL